MRRIKIQQKLVVFAFQKFNDSANRMLCAFNYRKRKIEQIFAGDSSLLWKSVILSKLGKQICGDLNSSRKECKSASFMRDGLSLSKYERRFITLYLPCNLDAPLHKSLYFTWRCYKNSIERRFFARTILFCGINCRNKPLDSLRR